MFEDLVNLYDDFTKNERTQALSRLAFELKFQFEKRSSFGDQSIDLRKFKLFQGKGVKRFLGIIDIPPREDSINQIRSYDYLVTKDLETKSTSVVELYKPEINAGEIRIKPKKAFGRLFSRGSKKSIEKQFNHQFTYESTYELPIGVMELLLEEPKMTIEVQDDTYLIYRKNKQIEILDIMRVVDFGEELVKQFFASGDDDYV